MSLVLMGGRVEVQACANLGARTLIIFPGHILLSQKGLLGSWNFAWAPKSQKKIDLGKVMARELLANDTITVNFINKLSH